MQRKQWSVKDEVEKEKQNQKMSTICIMVRARDKRALLLIRLCSSDVDSMVAVTKQISPINTSRSVLIVLLTVYVLRAKRIVHKSGCN